MSPPPIEIVLIGYGYWGPNLARNFFKSKDFKLRCICDFSKERRELASQNFPGVETASDLDQVLQDPRVEAVAIATPVSTHFELAERCLRAGKNLWIEKPVTSSLDEALRLRDLAREVEKTIFIDHTFLFTGAVEKTEALLSSGQLGDLLYYDSVRSNLGLFQYDANVVYDLAPHEYSILCYLLGKLPKSIRAMGSCHIGTDYENLAYIHLEYDKNQVAHIQLNWLSPVKMRRSLIGGTQKMLLYDDMEPTEKIKIYDKGVVVHTSEDPDKARRFRVDYRSGDMVAPKLDHVEALEKAAAHFARVIHKEEESRSGIDIGCQVMSLIDATQESLKRNGEAVSPRST